MFCPNCGAQVDDGCKFCTVCGKELNAARSMPAASSTPSGEQIVDGQWTCKRCGKINRPGVSCCLGCGSLRAALDAGKSGETNYNPYNPQKNSKKTLIIVLIIIVLLVGAFIGIQNFQYWWNADAIAAERAADAYEQAASSARKAKDDYNSLKGAIDDYRDAVDAVNDYR